MATTLLAVEDSNTMRKVLEITFAGEDYRTVTVGNAEQALEKLGTERPALALVDAGLDGAGYELCRQIKSTAPSTTVVLLTSRHAPYDRNRGSQVGADDFMDKPFDTQQLLDRVSALLSRAPTEAKPASTAAAPAARPRAQTLSYGTPAGGSPVGEARPPSALATPSSATPRVRTPTLTTGTPPLAASPGLPPSAPRAPVTSAGLGRPATPTVTGLGAAPAPGDNGLTPKLEALGLNGDQVAAVLELSRQVIEQAVWEVVPVLAETLIREEIERLTSSS